MCANFSERCYKALAKVPKGRVTTYKELARAVGGNACRAVGSAMRKNQNAPIIPCHRVVLSSGKIGQYAGGTSKKIALLSAEGVEVRDGRVLNFNQVFFRFKR